MKISRKCVAKSGDTSDINSNLNILLVYLGKSSSHRWFHIEINRLLIRILQDV